MTSKYDGMILDGRWKVISHRFYKKRNYFTLQNIMNGITFETTADSIRSIVAGKTSVSKVLKYKLYGNKYGYCFKRLSN